MAHGQEPPQLLKQTLLYQGRKFNFEVAQLRLPNQAEGVVNAFVTREVPWQFP